MHDSELRIIPNTFTSYDLSDSQALQAPILTSLQQAWISNLMAQIAEEKIRLAYDPENAMSFVQQEASLKGQLDILQHLLDSSVAANLELNQRDYQL